MAEYLIQDTTLDAIADAINAKTGGSSAMTPAEMVTNIAAIPTGGGGDPWEMLDAVNGNTLTRLERDDLLTVRAYMFYGNTALTTVRLPNATKVYASGFQKIGATSVFLPKADLAQDAFRECVNLKEVVIKSFQGYAYGFFTSDTNLEKLDVINGDLYALTSLGNLTNFKTMILRKSSKAYLSGANAFANTPFASGGTGGTIYIPKVLYDELGTGSANDYKAATNWSTVDAYGTITWAQIEGSIYETQYADGTPISSA